MLASKCMHTITNKLLNFIIISTGYCLPSKKKNLHHHLRSPITSQYYMTNENALNISNYFLNS